MIAIRAIGYNYTVHIICGLGNPGQNHQYSRHNAGFLLVDMLAETLTASWKAQKTLRCLLAKGTTSAGEELVLVKPQTFMNDSGVALRSVIEYYSTLTPDQLHQTYVVHDDLDLELGAYKIQFQTGPKVHNGLQSVYDHLKTDAFWHVRLGVDERGGTRTIPGSAYVLQQFSPESLAQLRTLIEQSVLPELSISLGQRS